MMARSSTSNPTACTTTVITNRPPAKRISMSIAEWMVGKLLGLEMKPGGFIGCDNVDLIFRAIYRKALKSN
jgi:hypothetical protein